MKWIISNWIIRLNQNMIIKVYRNHFCALHSYPTWTGVQFCPWVGQTQCCQATQPGSPGSWWNKPSRHCSHHQTSSGNPFCCGWTCCWPPLFHQSTWIHRCLAKECRQKNIYDCNLAVITWSKFQKCLLLSHKWQNIHIKVKNLSAILDSSPVLKKNTSMNVQFRKKDPTDVTSSK